MMINNNNLTEKLDLFKRKFAILQEISNVFVGMNDISSLSNLMLDLTISYTKSEKGSLMLLGEHDELYILAAKGMDTQYIRSYRAKTGEGIAGTVARNRSPVLVEDVRKDKRFKGKIRDRYKTGSFISCPIMSNKKLYGVLNINDKEDGTNFTDGEFELIKIISNHAAIIFDNVFLMAKLKSKAAELEEINKILMNTDIRKTEFLMRLSHELRNPLHSIKGAINYLQKTEGISRSVGEEFYDIISTESENLISIVENLIDFFRYEDEIKTIKKTVLNLADILQELSASKSLKTMLVRRNIRLKMDIKDSISDIVGDKIRIAQLFINLIGSLCYYLRTGDTIEITVDQDNLMRVNIVFSRNMPESIVPYLHETENIFHAAHIEERLKLYLVRKIIEIHRWKLFAENIGDNFIITINIPESTRQKIEAFIDTSLDLFAEFLSQLLDLNICSIMLRDEYAGELTIKGARGLNEDIIRGTRIKLGDRIAGWVALEGKPLLIEDLESDRRFSSENIPRYNTKSLLSLPLKINGCVIGVVNLNNKKTAEPFTMLDYYMASALCERISHFIKGIYSGDYKESEIKQFAESFDIILYAEKMYPKKNAVLAKLTIKIMDKLGALEEDKKMTLYASLVYDLGLLLIDESILSRKKLLPSDARVLRIHPYNTISLLNKFEYSDNVRSAILHHHEKYDGTGYPDGLKGKEIPFISRVLSVVDAFCAMTTERPYRNAYSTHGALNEIKKGSGITFDPAVVDALGEVIFESSIMERPSG